MGGPPRVRVSWDILDWMGHWVGEFGGDKAHVPAQIEALALWKQGSLFQRVFVNAPPENIKDTHEGFTLVSISSAPGKAGKTRQWGPSILL